MTVVACILSMQLQFAAVKILKTQVIYSINLLRGYIGRVFSGRTERKIKKKLIFFKNDKMFYWLYNKYTLRIKFQYL